jgi:hypothetical protein
MVASLSAPLEVAMTDKFVYRQNLEHLHKKLAETTDPATRKQILIILAEEQCKAVPKNTPLK